MACLGEDEVMDLVEGQIDEPRRRVALEHLDACEACRALLAHTARALMATADERGGASSDGLPDVGDVVGRFRITARLGAGAMGLVLAGEHLDLRRRVALKIVLQSAGVADDQLRLRLVREARAASAIRHPNVVAVHDVFTLEDGAPVMVMDLLEGESLRDRLVREGRLTIAATLAIARQVLSALEAAHAIGVVHRDLKPDNIFLALENGEEVVKIVDFGIAKLTAIDGPAAETAGLTQTGMLIGTPHYMAPEQAFADGAIDARADLWAVGVIVYECLSGTRPFEGASLGQVLKRLAQLSFRPIDEVVVGVPDELVRMVGMLLSERDLRPSTAREVHALLDGVDERKKLEVVASTTPGAVAMDGGSWLTRVRGPSPWYVAIVVAAAALVAVLVLAEPAAQVRRASARTPFSGETPLTRPEPPPAEPPPAEPPPAEPPPAEPPPSEPPPAPNATAPPSAPVAVAKPPRPRARPPAVATSTPVPTSTASPKPTTGPGDLLTDPPF